MIERGVDSIGSNDIDLEGLEQWNITSTSEGVAQRINKPASTVLVCAVSNGGLVCYSDNVEFSSIWIKEFCSLNII
jgi:hypothetical protein